MKAEFAILGGGFAGSLLALLLRRIGRTVLLIEASRHPRFRIGESSTPVADMMLRGFADTYGLTDLEPLSRYGSWKDKHPELRVGLKRGFSYFHHRPGRHFIPHPHHRNELLVAASSDDDVGDTHWVRADIDAFLFQLAAKEADVLEETEVASVSPQGARWRLNLNQSGEAFEAECDFLVDATGSGSIISSALGLHDVSSQMITHSRAIYSHFHGVRSWSDYLKSFGSAACHDHPFDADAAAQHHLLDEGWFWALRFDDDLASLGFALDERRSRLWSGPQESTETRWRRMLQRYPSLHWMMDTCQRAKTPGRIVESGRLQRLWNTVSGDGWAMLPSAAGFIDPLHSTGIAHTLYGVARLASIAEKHWRRPSLKGAIQRYGQEVQREIRHIDQLVGGCYRALPRLGRFTDYAMLYFAAATCFEANCRTATPFWEAGGFLLADNQAFREVVAEARAAVGDQQRTDAQYSDWMRDSLRPFNQVGLCDPLAKNMYRYTAAE